MINISKYITSNPNLNSTGFCKETILPYEVKGIRTFLNELKKDAVYNFKSIEGNTIIFIFFKGECKIRSGNKIYKSSEPCIYIPRQGSDNLIQAIYSNLGFLQISLDEFPNELSFYQPSASNVPYFLTISQGEKYSESIKSEKTTNRILLPDNVVRAVSIGSVQTTGPDRVEKHSHPMLEQFFFGLVGNNCKVIADGAEAHFVEYSLLHIPLGSEHEVIVREGFSLHYIWIDLFKTAEGINYLKDTHLLKNV